MKEGLKTEIVSGERGTENRDYFRLKGNWA